MIVNTHPSPYAHHMIKAARPCRRNPPPRESKAAAGLVSALMLCLVPGCQSSEISPTDQAPQQAAPINQARADSGSQPEIDSQADGNGHARPSTTDQGNARATDPGESSAAPRQKTATAEPSGKADNRPATAASAAEASANGSTGEAAQAKQAGEADQTKRAEAGASGARIVTPAKPTPTMALENIRVGMKGYGLTVFKGTKIEPFKVEVLSVVPNASPNRGVIWISCPDPRMQESGAVQGMSGSPIFLWEKRKGRKDEGTEGRSQADEGDRGGDKGGGWAPGHRVGEGGKLVGAFAFGFGYSKGCIVGVQPIEYMRQLAKRAEAGHAKDNEGGGKEKRLKDRAPKPMAHPRGSVAGLKMIRGLRRLARRRGADDLQRMHLDALNRIFTGAMEGANEQAIPSRTLDRREAVARLGQAGQLRGALGSSTPASLAGMRSTLRGRSAPPASSSLPRPLPQDGIAPAPDGFGNAPTGQAKPLSLPMAVGSSDLAEIAAPLFQPAGITPVAGNAAQLTTKPPKGIDADTPLQPGSVLAVPLAFGDLNLAAAGTVTDVLPDGTTLGFGHPMFGRGPTAVPMASGYVHFVVPMVSVSFKNAGSLDIVGSLVQDESTGVAGLGERTFTTAPAQITVSFPDQQPRQYNYHVVNHQMLTAPIATTLATASITAIQSPPIESTLSMQGTLTFSGGRQLKIDQLMAGTGAGSLTYDLAPMLSTILQNPFEEIELEKMDLDVQVEQGLHVARITDARLAQATVKPGESTTITVGYQPYGQARKTKSTTIDIPANVPDGKYQLLITDAPTYVRTRMQNRPFLQQPQTLGELFDLTRRQLDIKRDAVYLTLQLNKHELAVDRQAMPELPSSMAALFGNKASTGTTKYVRTINQTIEMPQLIQGQKRLTLEVRDKDKKKKQ